MEHLSELRRIPQLHFVTGTELERMEWPTRALILSSLCSVVFGPNNPATQLFAKSGRRRVSLNAEDAQAFAEEVERLLAAAGEMTQKENTPKAMELRRTRQGIDDAIAILLEASHMPEQKPQAEEPKPQKQAAKPKQVKKEPPDALLMRLTRQKQALAELEKVLVAQEKHTAKMARVGDAIVSGARQLREATTRILRRDPPTDTPEQRALLENVVIASKASQEFLSLFDASTEGQEPVPHVPVEDDTVGFIARLAETQAVLPYVQNCVAKCIKVLELVEGLDADVLLKLDTGGVLQSTSAHELRGDANVLGDFEGLLRELCLEVQDKLGQRRRRTARLDKAFDKLCG